MLRYAWLWLLVRVIGRLPMRFLIVAADIGGTLLWYVSPAIRATTRDHMRHVLGMGSSQRQRDRAARGCARTSGRYYADFSHKLHRPPDAGWNQLVAIEGIEHWFEAYDRGCGLIVCSAHLGNPEYLVEAVGRLGFDLMVLTEPLSPPRVHKLVHEVRASPGVRFVPTDLKGVREALTHVRQGGVLAILSDRDILGNGPPVTFFGERARLPSGPIELALRTNAPVLPAFVVRAPNDRYRAFIDPALEFERTGNREADLAAGMRSLAAALEVGIRRAPDQWFPLQPIWSGLAL